MSRNLDGSNGAENSARRRRIDIRRFLLRLISLPYFHANGRPRKWLRKVLFRSNGTPRRRTRFLVQHSNGRPRRLFRRWFEEVERRRLGADAAKAPRLWFFMGDSLDWLSSHAHVTGVGRVTLELFAGGLDGSKPPLWYPAVAGGKAGLRAWRRSAEADRAASAPLRALRELVNSAPLPPAEPKAGDHVLFTGVVWNAHYVKLFRQVTKAGIGFSVLVHDIIPILDPSISPPQQRAEFIEWMEEVARHAENIYVSSPSVRADIEAWMAAQGIARAAPIVIPFGPSLTPSAADAQPVALRPKVNRPFVLSVGTIDRRKNQTFLVRVWRRLLDEIGAEALPTLVLVGRDDLGLAASADAVALRAAGRLAVLSDVADEELDLLYRACLFTAFPSTMEGYGLPVADSLAYGKLVVASSLGAIRDHAGDLPLYFDPAREDEACRVLRHVIEHPEEREAREQRIAARPPQSWQEAADAVYRPLAAHFVAKDRISRLLPSLALGIPRETLIERARPWFEGAAPKVSILILNWNAATLTRTCIEHIWAHTTGVSYEIIVADNGSLRSDLAVLRDLGPGVTLLPLGVNRFFGEANNIMAEHARGELICLLNNDVFVAPGWLERLVGELEAHPEAGAVGPVFLFPDNTVQEAGGTLDSTGIPGRALRGEPASALEGLEAREVDYVSAAALVMSRDTFLEAGGFDLAYEPAYYEDTDLCFKLAALGKTIRLFPAVTVIHLEGYSTDENALPSARKKALGDLNRGKFLSRWGAYLKERSPAELAKVRAQFAGTRVSSVGDAKLRRALIYTPFDLTPGGGERYLLTLAAALTDRYKVTIATPHPYSALRLRTLGGLFDIDLSPCAITTEAELDALPTFELMVTMGNHIVPPVPGRGVMNFYHCQFPFPMPRDEPYHPGYLDDYLAILVNSSFTRDEVLRQLERLHLPSMAVEVFYPPVPQYQGEAGAKKPIILSVGRFFVGGHAKRQDLMIKAFARLHERLGGEVELHLAGSSLPSAEHMAYLRELHEMAEGLPVVFHVNCSAEELQELYRDAAIYWHATGLGADVVRHPELAEHFGIAIVEAMSAGCVCFALNAGGAREIIFDGENGFLYDNETELVAKTAKVIAAAEERARIGESARARAAIYDPRQFAEELAELIP